MGESKKLNIVAVNEQGNAVNGGILIYQMLRQEGYVPTSGAKVDSLGNVTGHSPGIYNLIVIRTDPDNKSFAKRYVQVQVINLETAKIELLDFPEAICIISREGASNRKNGIVILDVSDPGNVEIISTYDQQPTGGVHNLFISKGHVYALSNGQRYDVINIEDPANPYKVGKFQLDNPARAIHDV